MSNENYQSNSTSAINNNQDNNSFLQLRLDTRPLLRDIEQFLSAKRVFIYVDPKTGETGEKEEVVGEPLANDKGITAILNMFHLRANHHVVQGNIEQEMFKQLISDTRKELASSIVVNCYEWGIEDSKLNMVIDSILGFYKPFLSRLLGNKERESYMNQFKTQETIVQNSNQGGAMSAIKGFAGGLNR
jgi:hypothetical protein